MQLSLYGSIAWRHPFGMARVLDWAEQFGWDSVDARGMCLDAPGDIGKLSASFGYDMLGPRNIRPTARKELRQQLKDRGLHLLGIYCASPVNLDGDFGDMYRELFRQYLQLSADLDSPWIRAINNTTCNYQGPDMSREEAYERTIDGLRAVGSAARDVGVGILLENNENTITPDAQTLLQVKQDLDGACQVGIAYDAVNAYFQGHDPVEGMRLLAGQIDILHLKNVCRHTDQRAAYMPRGDYSYSWTSLADGDLDWKQLLAQAAADGFDGPLTFEYVNPFKGMPTEYWDQLREPEDAAREEAGYLRDVLAAMG